MQKNALMVKSLDTNHPVASSLGEINQPTTADVNTIVNTTCAAVDVWGANIYRGASFYTLFTDWQAISSKPLYVAEFGVDDFYTTSQSPVSGYEDQADQASWDHSLWLSMSQNLSANDPTKACVGGTVFEWNDEWW